MSGWYEGMTLPSGRTPSSSQLSKMDDDWTEENITRDGTKGTIGMFGVGGKGDNAWGTDSDEYYFYLRFNPYDDVDFVTTNGAVFRMWF